QGRVCDLRIEIKTRNLEEAKGCRADFKILRPIGAVFCTFAALHDENFLQQSSHKIQSQILWNKKCSVRL
ncbi:MAG: hypothetical protein ABI230_07720, partial [Aestuariivirga sp.]